MCFLKKENRKTGKHHKPERVKVILDKGKRTAAQRKYDKQAEKIRKANLKKVTQEENLARLTNLSKRARKHKNG